MVVVRVFVAEPEQLCTMPTGRRNNRRTRLKDNIGGEFDSSDDNLLRENIIGSVNNKNNNGWSGTNLMLKIIRALLARMLFVVHSLMTIWQTVQINDNPTYWSFAFISIGILVEGSYNIIMRAGDERKW